MSSEDSNGPRLPKEREPALTAAQLDSLTERQLRALLMVAADPHADDATATVNAADVERLLAEMSGSRGHGELLATAVKETTSVEELIRIKELAKGWAGDAVDSLHRDAARLLYHVAVAAAFTHHAAAISGRPLRKQQLLYEKFADAWTGHSIGRVFREAATRLTDGDEPGRRDMT